MNKFILLLIACSFTILNSNAQPTHKFNYQAIARDAAGGALINHNLGIKISIEDSAAGPVLYSESFSTTTNQFGLFTLKVGGGNVLSGNFDSINWSLGNQWLKVEMDTAGGNNYVVMGESQLMSVPFANYAAESSPQMPINFRLSRATGLSINSSLPPVTILWNSSTYINNCSISGDSAFVAPVMGLYHFGIGFNGSSSGQGTLEVNIFVNSISVNRKIYSTSILRLSFNIDDNLFLNAGDKVYVTLVTTSGYFSFNGAKDIQFTGYKIN